MSEHFSICEDRIDVAFPANIDYAIRDLCPSGARCGRTVNGGTGQPRLVFASIHDRGEFLAATKHEVTSPLGVWLRRANPRLTVQDRKTWTKTAASLNFLDVMPA